MLRGEKVGLRARIESDSVVLHAELYDDVATWLRMDTRPWRPIPAGSSADPFRVAEPNDEFEDFAVVELAEGEALAGSAVLWGLDRHNRSAHVGISLLPSCRGRGLGLDAVKVMCEYGFAIRGLNRLAIETFSDNAPMLRAAERSGFVREGLLRQAAWVSGHFLDEVVLGLLAEDWNRAKRKGPASEPKG